MKNTYIGIDIGGTKCAVILGKKSGAKMNVIDRVSFPTETKRGPRYALDTLITSVDAIMHRQNIVRRSVSGIGVSCGGPLDSKRGVVLSPPNLPGWDNIRIVHMLEKRFGIPAALENDANACALAEWRFGAGRGYRNVVFFTFGTGLGAGLVLDDRLYRGTNDMAGEAGHIRLAPDGPTGYGKAGSFEGFCSGGGIAQLARKMIEERRKRGRSIGLLAALSADDVTAKDIAAAAVKGDTLAKDIFAVSGDHLGRGLSVIIDILNPEVIILGSVYARCERFIKPHAMRVIRTEALPRSRSVCRIVPAELGESIGDYAALSIAASIER
ncbi:MAG: ROK family protein [Spirochaetes bacterium]|nr:ROK family protein [Spirochaetota bacterium]